MRTERPAAGRPSGVCRRADQRAEPPGEVRSPVYLPVEKRSPAATTSTGHLKRRKTRRLRTKVRFYLVKPRAAALALVFGASVTLPSLILQML